MAEYRASHRFARISPRKVRALADIIRGKFADDALALLGLSAGALRMLEKVLKSAVGNAEDRRAPSVGSLKVTVARVDPGPMFKRLRPRSRGMATFVVRRMSHIHVTLE